MKHRTWAHKKHIRIRVKLRRMLKCVFSGEKLGLDERASSSESLATRDYCASRYSSRAAETETRAETSNIEEAESSLRESGFLNYEEARALLGRLEFQKGNIEAAFQVFEGIDISAVRPKLQSTISSRCGTNRRHSQSDAAPPMSMHAASLLCEAIFLKAKSLQYLGRFRDAAETCNVILDTVESASPEGLYDDFSIDCKLHESLTKAVELLPELWKLAGASPETILSYRRALLHHWNLDIKTISKIEKEFAIYLLYSGSEASPPNLRSQMEGSFVPRNNIEEAVLLFFILLRKLVLGRIEWDPTIMDHLSFALSISGELRALARQIEELLPGLIGRKERYVNLALCYIGDGDIMAALNLLRNMLSIREDNDSITGLLLASKICCQSIDWAKEGTHYAQKALLKLSGGCNQLASVAYCLLGISLSAQSRSDTTDSDRSLRQSEALVALETAEKAMDEREPNIIYYIGLENAEQRKLDVAIYYANQLLRIEAGSDIRGYMLLARILSAQQQYTEAEIVIDAALGETGKWDQGELLRTKAKLQIAQRHYKNAIETYTKLLAILQVQEKSFRPRKLLVKNGTPNRSLEIETWNDLANIYTRLSQWRDAEVCLLRSEAICPHFASRWHSSGLLYEAKGLPEQALSSFEQALDVEPTHIPSLISTATLLMKLSDQSFPVVRSFLCEALQLDRTNSTAWYKLGLLCKAEGAPHAVEAAECFQAAALLENFTPVEPFR